jgi:hypothetical protein
MQKVFWGWCLCLLMSFSGQAQIKGQKLGNPEMLTPANREMIHSYELQLKSIGDSMLDGHRPKVRTESYRAFVPLLKKALRVPGSFYYPFDSLKFMKKLVPEDQSFRLLNWLIKFDDGTYHYVGAIQMNTADSLRLIPLSDQSAKLDSNVENTVLEPKEWFGALYYTIIQSKLKGKKYYLLLGWNGADIISDKKVIEVLSFDNKGKPKFGAPIFEQSGKMKHRIVFTFTGSATMLLNYLPEYRAISFDHLAATKPELEGKPWTYVPDGSYDYFQEKKGKWIFREDLFESIKGPIKEAGEEK